jgi:hypothetical protein
MDYAVVSVTCEDGVTEIVRVMTDSIRRAKEIAESSAEVLYRGGATEVAFLRWESTREEN